MRIRPVLIGLLTLILAADALTAGGISGRVTRESDGAPLPARVEILTYEGEWINDVACDASGNYSASGIPAGSYIAWAYLENLPDYVEEFWPGTPFWNERGAIAVTDGATTGGVDFQLAPGARLTGKIVAAATGAPIAGVSVGMADDDWNWYDYGQSGADGTYEIRGIPKGVFVAWASIDEGGWVSEYTNDVYAEGFAEQLEIKGTEILSRDFDLLREAAITGTILRTDTSAPIADAYVSTWDESLHAGNSADSIEDGTFRIGQLPPGSYRLWADAENYGDGDYQDENGNWILVTVAEGETKGGVVIRLAPGGAIAGTILRRDGRTPVAWGWAGAWRLSDDAGGSTNADENGNFRIEGLPDGIYNLVAAGDQRENLVATVLADENGVPVPITVVVGTEVSGLEVVLPPGGIARGEVRSKTTGNAVGDAHVVLWSQGLWMDAYTDDTGAFEIAGVPPGNHFLTASHEDFVTQTFDGAFDPERGTPVTFVENEVSAGIDFELIPGGRIAGRVLASDTGLPLAGIWVGAAIDEWVWVPNAGDETDADGNFVITSVPEGQRFFVGFYDDTGTYASQWYKGRIDFAKATPVAVTAGQTTTLDDVVMEIPGVVSYSPTSFSFSGTTDQESLPPQTFTVSNAGPGRAVVVVWTDEEWLSENYDDAEVFLDAGESLNVDLTVWTWGLAAGTYTASVHAYNFLTDEESTIPVALNLQDSPPRLDLAPTRLWFDSEIGKDVTVAQAAFLANLGGGNVAFTATPTVSWLSVTPTAGSLTRGSDVVALTIDPASAALSEGEHTGTIIVSTSVGDATITVTLNVNPPAGGEPEVSTPQAISIYIPGGLPPDKVRPFAETTVEVKNAGTGTLYWNGRFRDEWVAIDPPRGQIPAGGSMSVTITVDPAQLVNGINSTVLEVGANATKATTQVDVTLGSAVDENDRIVPSADGQLVVPILVHAAGVGGSQFVSDLWLAHRPTGRSITATLGFVPAGADGTVTAITTPLELASGQTIPLLDVMRSWLGERLVRGSLVIQSADIEEIEAVSRTYNLAPEGTFGQEVPAVPTGDGSSRLDGKVYVAGLEKSSRFRSNLFVTEVAGQGARIRVGVVDADGFSLGTKEYDVLAFSTLQINDVIGSVGHVGDAIAVRAEVEILGGDGRIAVIGSVVDNATQDPTTLVGVPRDNEAAVVVVPVVAHAAGVAGTQWVSDVALSNVDAAGRQISIVYYDRNGGRVGAKDLRLLAGQTVVMADVVEDGFGVSNGRGSLVLGIDPPGGVVVHSRTYNLGANGTFGQGIPGLAAGESLSAARGLIRLIALHGTTSFRTNVGITEIAGEPIRVAITLRDASGQRLLGYREVDIAAHGNYQTDVFALMGLSGLDVFAATAMVQVVSGSGRAMAYASMVDNRTGDGTTLPPPERVTTGVQ